MIVFWFLVHTLHNLFKHLLYSLFDLFNLSEMADGGGGGGGDGEGLSVWEYFQSWWGGSNSDNSGGDTAEEIGLGKKKPPLFPRPPPSASSNVNPLPVMVASKKRGRGGGGDGDGEGSGGGEVKEGKAGESDHDHQMHILVERERRKKMKAMFANLHALLPQLPCKADKSTIVDEAVSFIKTLERTHRHLQSRKLERLEGLATFGGAGPSSSTRTPQNQASNKSREAFLADQVFSGGGSAGGAPVDNSSNVLSISRHPSAAFQTWTSSNVVLNVCGDDAQINVISKKKSGLFSAICCALEKHNIELVTAQASSDGAQRMYMIQAKVNRVSDTPTVDKIYKQAANELMSWI